MPVTADINHRARLVVTRASGRLPKADFSEHIEGVWRDPAIAGFDEVIDAIGADVSGLSAEDLSELVNASVAVDSASRSRLALCVGSARGFGLARMYGSMRESRDNNVREVRVFYDTTAAHAWLADAKRD